MKEGKRRSRGDRRWENEKIVRPGQREAAQGTQIQQCGEEREREERREKWFQKGDSEDSEETSGRLTEKDGMTGGESITPRGRGGVAPWVVEGLRRNWSTQAGESPSWGRGGEGARGICTG